MARSLAAQPWLRATAFVASAALVALAIHSAPSHPLLALGLVIGLIAAWLPVPLARRRARRLLLSGRADEVAESWERALGDLPHADTTVPLLQATALASAGLVDRARTALGRAERGSAGLALREHRLVIETLLDAFDGEPARALDKARELGSLPLPALEPKLAAHVSLLRSGVAALARAFAHRTEERDPALLWHAAQRNTLIHWPLRYAAVVALIDHGRPAEARKLLRGAPEWPEGSAFREFHCELAAHAGATTEPP